MPSGTFIKRLRLLRGVLFCFILSRVIRIKKEVTHSGGETGRESAPHHSASISSAPRFPSTLMMFNKKTFFFFFKFILRESVSWGGAETEEERNPKQALVVALDVGLEPTNHGLNSQIMRS